MVSVTGKRKAEAQEVHFIYSSDAVSDVEEVLVRGGGMTWGFSMFPFGEQHGAVQCRYANLWNAQRLTYLGGAAKNPGSLVSTATLGPNFFERCDLNCCADR